MRGGALNIQSCINASLSSQIASASSATTKHTELAYTAGIQLMDSSLLYASAIGYTPITIRNSTGHGITLTRSSLTGGYGALAGGNNTGFGVYLKDSSIMLVPPGYLNTLTGSSGDVTTDGTTEACKWTSIESDLIARLTDVSNACSLRKN
jgi:hypothetical protein